MVQRYDFGSDSMYESDRGNYVEYEDYEYLETKYENLCHIVRDAMRKLDLEILDEERITCNDS